MLFKDILKKYREISFSERDKGDRFERLIKAYFLTDPQYTTTLKDVWYTAPIRDLKGNITIQSQ